MDVPLSDSDIRGALPGATVSRLEDLPASFDAWRLPIVSLYAQAPQYGHWCAILDTVDADGAPAREFFDPYGRLPDRQLAAIAPDYRASSGQDQARISQFMHQHPNPVYSAARLQSTDQNVATCGRHCILRIACAEKSAEAYAERVRLVSDIAGLTPDSLVVELTQ